MPDMPDMRAQVSARRFAARRSHPRRPRAGQQIRCRNLPCITPLIHTAPHLPPTPAACELLAICPTPHALPAQLHTPPAHCMCTAISQCVPPQVAAHFSQHPGTQLSRARTPKGRCAPIFAGPFHSGGMCDSGAAGGLAADRLVLRTAFSVSSDSYRSCACPEARFACLRAILPPQRMHATLPYQHIPLSLCIGLSHASQLMHASPYMHYTHFEHAMSHALLMCVMCAVALMHADSEGIRSSAR